MRLAFTLFSAACLALAGAARSHSVMRNIAEQPARVKSELVRAWSAPKRSFLQLRGGEIQVEATVLAPALNAYMIGVPASDMHDRLDTSGAAGLESAGEDAGTVSHSSQLASQNESVSESTDELVDAADILAQCEELLRPRNAFRIFVVGRWLWKHALYVFRQEEFYVQYMMLPAGLLPEIKAIALCAYIRHYFGRRPAAAVGSTRHVDRGILCDKTSTEVDDTLHQAEHCSFSHYVVVHVGSTELAVSRHTVALQYVRLMHAEVTLFANSQFISPLVTVSILIVPLFDVSCQHYVVLLDYLSHACCLKHSGPVVKCR
eukprot:6302-Heterococcus_DN1.PRE.3